MPSRFVVVSVLWGIVYEIIIAKGEVIPGLFFLTFTVGIILFALLSIYGESMRKAAVKRPLPEPTLPKAADTGRLLSESRVEPIPGVTERTTDLLMKEKGNAG